MPKRSRKVTRARERRVAAAIQLLILGAVIAVAPMVLGRTVLGKALGPLFPLGLLLLLIGGALFWWAQTQDKPSEPLGSGQFTAAPAFRHKPAPPWRPTPMASAATTAKAPEVERRPISDVHDPQSSGAANHKPEVWGQDVFAAIEWRRFEAVIERLFQQAGFETRSLSHGADLGVDVWLYSKTDATQPVSVVQCKHWQGKRVGVDRIRELRGVMAAHNVPRGQFATTSTFTPDAMAFGKENSINLLDVDRLLGLIAQRTPEQQSQLLAVALEGDYWRPTCVNCGTKLVERAPRKGGSAFWGCSAYPRCKTTMVMSRHDSPGAN